MFASNTARPTARRRHHRSQQGVMMIVVMIALMVMLAGGVALMRSSDANASLAGQLAFRRDLKNQGERGIAWAMAQLSAGNLSGDAARKANLTSVNYSATRLSNDDQGIPNVLLNDSTFTAAGMTGADISSSSAGVSVRTVIDRLCQNVGEATAANCTLLNSDCGGTGAGGDSPTEVLKCATTTYRISVRVTGPRSTQAFFQAIVGS
jgi:type IV pilus assembly protein PilX